MTLDKISIDKMSWRQNSLFFQGQTQTKVSQRAWAIKTLGIRNLQIPKKASVFVQARESD